MKYKSSFILILYVLLLIEFSISGVQSQILNLNLNSTNGFDSFIEQDKSGNNFGSSVTLDIDSENSKIERAIFYFNLSALPSSSIIHKATLTLNQTSGTGSFFNVSLKRITNDWQESSVTWNNRNTTTTWTNAGGDFSNTNYSITLINNTLGNKIFDVTDLIQEFTNGTYINYGFALIPSLQGGNNLKQFYSKEGLSAPFLTINYTYDLAGPNISITSPENKSYTTKNINLNYTVEDYSEIDRCWYSLDGGANNTLAGCADILLTNIGEGSHTLRLYSNDTLGNINMSLVIFFVDTISPSFSNFVSNPLNGSTYYPGQTYNFNITIYDLNGINEAGINFNGINSTITGQGTYTFNITDISAGTYQYYWWANDSNGNYNASGVRYFTVAKAFGNVSLYFNGINNNLTIEYMQQLNVSASSITGNVKLYRNNIDVTGQNGQNVLLGAGYYTYKANSTGNQNYTDNSLGTTYYLNVTRASPTGGMSISITPSESVDFGTQTSTSTTETNTGDGDMAYILYREGTAVSNPNIATLNGGNYIYEYKTTGGQNYTSGTISKTLTVNRISNPVYLLVNGNSSNINIKYGENINASGSAVQSGVISLYRNNIDVTGQNGQNVLLGAGYYTYKANSTGNQNYMSNSSGVTYEVNISKAESYTYVYLNNSRQNASIYQGQEIAINSSSNNNQGKVQVYVNGNKISEGYNTHNITNLSSIGVYNITSIYVSTNNYSYSYETWFVSVNEPLDTTPPNVVIYNPMNKTYGTNSIFLNYSVQDNKIVSSCKYSLDYSTNISLAGCLTTSISGLTDGPHVVKIYAKDNSNNENSSEVSFWIDNSGPIYSNIMFDHPGIYSQNYTQMNITWTDSNLQTVLIESDFSGSPKNYTMQNEGGGLYTFKEILPAGNFYWKSYANDSFGHYFSTPNQNFNIQKSNEGLSFYVNGNQSDIGIIYGDNLKVNAVSVDNSAIIYKNGNEIINGFEEVLGAGYYNYTSVFNGNQNYSYSFRSYYVNVTKASPAISLLLNDIESEISVNVFENINVKASPIRPYEEIELYEDNNLIYSGISAELNVNYSLAGVHIWNATIGETENYTYGSKSFEINVNDADFPSYSNIKTNYNSPLNYNPFREYQFNSTWRDNIGINEVILEFDGINYSLSKGEIKVNNEEYYTSFGSLSAKDHKYRWYGIDSSGNMVRTSELTYKINKAISALYLSMTPSNKVIYGEEKYVDCISNNIESNPEMTRNGESVSIPEEEMLPAGDYVYICTLDSDENYTSASVTGELKVIKADPNIMILLNNQSSDISLPIGGGFVKIISNLSILIGEANITLIIDGIYILNATNNLEYNVSFDSGTHNISVHYEGNDNYNSYTMSSYVVVQEEVQHQRGGGGSSRGSSGGGVIIINENKTISLEFQSLGDIIISPGESKILELNVKNNGSVFLNKCTLKGLKEYESWIKSDTIKNINPGEITEYKFEIKIPIEANKSDEPKLYLDCLEKEFEVPIKTIILDSGLDIEIDNLGLVNENELEINYTAIGNADFEESIVFRVYDFEDNLLSEKESRIEITSGKIEYSDVLDVTKAEKGLLKVEISKKSGGVIVDEFFVYDSSQPITGLAFFDKIGGNSFYMIFIAIFFLVIGFLIVKRMRKVKDIKEIGKNHSVKRREIKEKHIVNKTQEKEVKPKKVKWSNLFEEKDKIAQEKQKENNDAISDEQKKENVKFETYGGNSNNKGGWETY